MNFKKTMRKLFFARPSSVLGIDLGTEFVEKLRRREAKKGNHRLLD